MSSLQQLAEQLNEIARPGIAVDSVDDRIRFKVVSQRHPESMLWIGSAAWKPGVAGNEHDRAQLIMGFDAFNDAVATLVAQTDLSDVIPIVIGQEIFNLGILRNPYDLMDLVHFDIDYLETDGRKWEEAE